MDAAEAAAEAQRAAEAAARAAPVRSLFDEQTVPAEPAPADVADPTYDVRCESAMPECAKHAGARCAQISEVRRALRRENFDGAADAEYRTALATTRKVRARARRKARRRCPTASGCARAQVLANLCKDPPEAAHRQLSLDNEALWSK